MLGKIFGTIFGSNTIVDRGLNMIDEAIYTESEKAEDKMQFERQKAEDKIKLMNAYAPFKIAQRVIAFGFVFVFLFIMVNGILGTLYGIVPMENVDKARDFADKMWLGEIILMIVTFYFGGGLAESIKRKG